MVATAMPVSFTRGRETGLMGAEKVGAGRRVHHLAGWRTEQGICKQLIRGQGSRSGFGLAALTGRAVEVASNDFHTAIEMLDQ